MQEIFRSAEMQMMRVRKGTTWLACGTTYVSGKVGQAASFDGVDDYVLLFHCINAIKCKGK